jgi:carbonic anhydrase
MEELLSGYKEFRGGRYADDAARYRQLGERGQKPHTLVVACCDSRVDPATIFSAGPGQMFVLRNVANLVPAWGSEETAELSTAAAVEFAVGALGVKRILVLGHGDCGGVKAALAAAQSSAPAPTGSAIPHVGRWIAPVTELCRAKASALAAVEEPDRGRLAELENVRNSIANLMTMPVVSKRVADGSLALVGAHFEIASGRLLVWDRESGEFRLA